MAINYSEYAEKMETVEISGKALLKRKKVEMSIENTWKKDNMNDELLRTDTLNTNTERDSVVLYKA